MVISGDMVMGIFHSIISNFYACVVIREKTFFFLDDVRSRRSLVFFA